MVNTGVQVSINTLLSFLLRVYTYNDRPTFVQNHLATVQPGRKEPSNPDTRPCTMIFDTNTSSQHREPPRAYLTRTASDSCGPPRSFSNSLFIPLLFSVSPLLPDSEPLSPVLLADKKETTNKTATDNFSTFDLRSPSVGRFSTRRPSIS